MPLPVERNVVHAHGPLLEAMRTQRAGHGGKRAIWQQAAIRRDGQYRQRIGSIVGDGEKPARRIEGEMHRIVAAGRLAVQHGELAAVAIDYERRRLAAIAVDRIEAGAPGVDGEERRVLQAIEMLQVGEAARAAVGALRQTLQSDVLPLAQ